MFSVQNNVPQAGGNNAIRREHDRKIGQGTMSRGGAWCPCCGKPGTVAMEMEDVRAEGRAGRIGAQMTAVVVDGPEGKEYRLPTEHELSVGAISEDELQEAFKDVPFGIPDEPTPKGGGSGAGRAFSVQGYGMMRWRDLFTSRQLAAMATFIKSTKAARSKMADDSFPASWVEALASYLAIAVDRLADYSSAVCSWHISGEKMRNTFGRFALPIVWDFAEVGVGAETTGSYLGAIEWIARFVAHPLDCLTQAEYPTIQARSATKVEMRGFDLVLTDPPYYDAIPYSDLMDFFYIWLRRTAHGLSNTIDETLRERLSPKWDHSANDGELIDDSSRHGNDAAKSKQVYEDGMARAFEVCAASLHDAGRLVIVFANKQPDAWETLVSAIVRAGFAVDGSWPIQTEMGNRVRSLGSAALASSVWLVCKKRPETARPGWDNTVLAEMRSRIYDQLRSFWDAGIRGPDFVWAATGPAMEAYSKRPIVKKADTPGELMTVSEFLRAVRRIVVDFVVGRVLTGPSRAREEAVAGPLPDGHGSDQEIDTSALDDVTTYYLLHRHDFKMNDAPADACILYAISCNLSEGELADKYDVLVRTGGLPARGAQAGVDKDDDGEPGEGDADAEGEAEKGTGSTFKLKPWKQRKRPGMGMDPVADSARWRRLQEEARGPWLSPDFAPPEPTPPVARMIPLIDQVHRLMHLWKAGDQIKVDGYLGERGLRRNAVFQPLLQALIELSPEGSEERSVLESIMNHVRARGVAAAEAPTLPYAAIEDREPE